MLLSDALLLLTCVATASAPPPWVRDKTRKRSGRRQNFKKGEAAGDQAARSAVGSSRGEGGSGGSGARSTGARSTQGNCIDPYCQGLQHGSKVAKACGTPCLLCSVPHSRC